MLWTKVASALEGWRWVSAVMFRSCIILLKGFKVYGTDMHKITHYTCNAFPFCWKLSHIAIFRKYLKANSKSVSPTNYFKYHNLLSSFSQEIQLKTLWTGSCGLERVNINLYDMQNPHQSYYKYFTNVHHLILNQQILLNGLSSPPGLGVWWEHLKRCVLRMCVSNFL